MTSLGILQILVFFALIFVCTKPLGAYMARVFQGQRTFMHPMLRWLEVLTYKVSGVSEEVEQRWTQYTASLLSFSIFGFLLVYFLQRAQGFLPFNPQHFGAGQVSPDLAFNTATSFLTNMNWQAYSGESTLSYFVQMGALTVQNFVSAAAGMAVAIAVVHGFARHEMRTIGNFWVDVTRASVYVLLPIAFVSALFLCSQGVIQNLNPYTDAATVEGAKQTIAQGPVASQEAIKMLGTNGGGFFNANSAHPFENPTPLSNFVQMVSIFAISAGLTWTYGRMARDQRQGWALWAAMVVLSIAGVTALYWAEAHDNPALRGFAQMQQGSGNLEGKETRFGLANSALFSTVTTDASCGAVNTMHDSLTPLGGLVPLVNIKLGEVIFGGVGAGLYGMLVFVVLTVFIAVLMVGRTPEYLGKKIQAYEVKMAMLSLLVLAVSILGFAAWAAVSQWGLAGLSNSGPHGLSEILYAFSSANGNNGSAFAGLTANTPWYNTTIGLAMLIGRFLMIIPIMALAGSLVQKKISPPSAGTFPVSGGTFVVLLLGTILLVGALNFLPALTLGPIVEHFLTSGGKLF